MALTVSVIAAGSMGSAVGQRLAEHGATVLTLLEGRSEATKMRAHKAGMIAASADRIAAADIILSIVPPGEALRLARDLAPALAAAQRKPAYVDCNAVNPDTVATIAETVRATGAAFVDAGIIGGPPKPDYAGPMFYLSGEHAGGAGGLADFGLKLRLLDDRIGSASALKMSYAGITKGLTAIGAMMMLAASRAGQKNALHRELAESQPQLLAWFERQIPGMFPRAYRWVAEMEEISGFLTADPAGRDLFEAAARFYGRIAEDADGPNAETAILRQFFVSP